MGTVELERVYLRALDFGRRLSNLTKLPGGVLMEERRPFLLPERRSGVELKS